ncbi:kelch 3 [Olea europaea subsp. europaea]|uniref:Kelch 3 n=1 Tax=Olea europaea subsp. europaea TaxID=158383 RepID=A0A8S0Q599_OLEEU|nr:kelch 3 [Olea europaea subsp. europaea]
MGGGKKTQTFVLNESSPSFASKASYAASARNLRKSQLGGVIFGCTRGTFRECLSKQLFGLPAHHFVYVKNIEPGLPLFLFNYSDRTIHGIFEAASCGQLNINPYAWTSDGSEKTPYPAQVQIRMRTQCQALPELQYKPIIVDNYYSLNHFWFELDHAQASKLLSKLSSLAVSPSTFIPQIAENRTATLLRFPSNDNRKENGTSYPPSSTDNFAISYDAIGTMGAKDDSLCLDGNNQFPEAALQNQMVDVDQKNFIYMKLKELQPNGGHTDAVKEGNAVESAIADDFLGLETAEKAPVASEEGNNGSSFNLSCYPVVITQLCQEIEELKAFKKEQTQKMESLEKKLVVAEEEIYRLENRCMALESGSCLFVTQAEEAVVSFDGLHLNLDELIFLVGGYDGESWSSALHSYSPLHDVVKSLKPMSSVRAYASVAKLNAELYVFGGGNGALWYDTVESYNPFNDQWTLRPPLNERKGNLASAVLDGKIFALGGGNGVESFSCVEMFDSEVGRWISTRSMLQKRFSLAASEYNGAIYAVGGYDGKEYLKSAERFDPREHSWTRIASMETPRGCHSLVVMNEKLYAIGGYDGNEMVRSMEIYDPRLGKWMTDEPLNRARGYSATAILNESIYVIGGADTANGTVDNIERYEGRGWQETNLKAVGKRCFASAIVLGES